MLPRVAPDGCMSRAGGFIYVILPFASMHSMSKWRCSRYPSERTLDAMACVPIGSAIRVVKLRSSHLPPRLLKSLSVANSPTWPAHEPNGCHSAIRGTFEVSRRPVRSRAIVSGVLQLHSDQLGCDMVLTGPLSRTMGIAVPWSYW